MISLFRKRELRASRIDIKPPTPSRNRSGIAVVAIARNEEKNIHDWLAFHSVAGVSSIFLYDNMSTDRTAQIAQQFKHIPVTIIPWQLHTIAHSPKMILPRQLLAYCHAICTYGGNFERMAFIDIDEYLVPKTTLSISEAIGHLKDKSNISLPWAMFGHSGHISSPSEADPFAYDLRAEQSKGPLLNYKCMVDPCKVTQVSTHKFETNDMKGYTSNTMRTQALNKFRNSNFAVFDHLQLNHYYLRSYEDMQSKISSGAVSGASNEKRARTVLKKKALIDASPVQDHTAKDFLARHGIKNTTELRSRYPLT